MNEENQTQKFIETGKRVIKAEARALEQLENTLESSFACLLYTSPSPRD